MSMMFTSERLLEREIEKLSAKGPLDDDEAFLKSIYEKELAVLRRLDIEMVDTRGELEDVTERLAGKAVYFMAPGELEELRDKAGRFDAILGICRGGGKEDRSE